MGAPLSRRLGDWSPEEFEAAGQEVLGLIARHFASVEQVRVLPDMAPRELIGLLDSPLPDEGEEFSRILDDTRTRVIPNLTHWNHPNFHAYFAISGSGPGVLADTLTSALNVNAMLWKTGPAASALEGVVLRWMAEMAGYHSDADGVLVNGASLSTFYALAAAREELGLSIRELGMSGRDLPVLRVYCTEHAHSSIDKAVIALGVGLSNLVKIPGDGRHRMRPDLLKRAIAEDLAKGYRPFAAVAVAGTTSTGAADPLGEIGQICREYGLWLHLDAAYGGFYNLVPRVRAQVEDFRVCDSVVLNPHKGLFCPLEVSALYSRRKGKLAAAFSLMPEYLRTDSQDGSVNYMDFSLQLGRSSRALKLWWIIRSFGRRGLTDRMAEHLRLAEGLAARVEAHPHLERISASPYPLVCFRLIPRAWRLEYDQAGEARRVWIRDQADRLTARLLDRINADGKQFVSHTVVAEGYILRAAIGNIRTMAAHVDALWERIDRTSRELAAEADPQPLLP